MTTIKVLIISAVILFVSTTSYYSRSETETPRADEDNAEKVMQVVTKSSACHSFYFIAGGTVFDGRCLDVHCLQT